MQKLLDRTNQALGRLDGITLLLPDPDQFIYTFVRKEAVLSSQIEGTQSSLSDLLLFEHDAAPGALREDARETANYIAALESRPRGDRPARRAADSASVCCARSTRRLLQSGRGSQTRTPESSAAARTGSVGAAPGLARFVPPPWQEVAPAMADLERFIHDEPQTDSRARQGGAGPRPVRDDPPVPRRQRPGRPAVDHVAACAREGVLGPSAARISASYFKRNRDDYYDRLQRDPHRRRLGGLAAGSSSKGCSRSPSRLRRSPPSASSRWSRPTVRRSTISGAEPPQRTACTTLPPGPS